MEYWRNFPSQKKDSRSRTVITLSLLTIKVPLSFSRFLHCSKNCKVLSNSITPLTEVIRSNFSGEKILNSLLASTCAKLVFYPFLGGCISAPKILDSGKKLLRVPMSCPWPQGKSRKFFYSISGPDLSSTPKLPCVRHAQYVRGEFLPAFLASSWCVWLGLWKKAAFSTAHVWQQRC